ncbi:hypothetical protein HYPSUDRAFT_36804 [Hypholoma sublateritium FD-334 SS-4]|uniref:G-patch domain-containing protein n=1 Tax=Hypholoma sublateritium (strain FD-334 SS-4) TaxID=945553 RepID=A0A0D2MPR8_HYPSF|nr:hypothetical protein HYPSUDRAFT_36804 [Hypholoma sublateritium FD-334 SS-4]
MYDGPHDDDDDDDDISLVSRSPSPRPSDAMDVDDALDRYDEYVRGASREVITVDTKLKPTNKGFALLAKLGWVEGQPVGLSGEGRTEPIPFHVKSDLTGLGKTTQDVRMIETTVSQRRGLDSERQQKESEEQRKLREDSVARKSALESEISSTLRAFYCTLCDKQFKNVAQYDEHTNSYAHHHKARFKDMQANVRIKPQEEVDKRKEKERKREEKELRKIAAAAGIKMPKPPAAVASTSAAVAPPAGGMPGMDVDIDGEPVVPKRSGWASISDTGAAAGARGGFAKSGWATVGSPANAPPSSSRLAQPPLPPPPPPPPAEAPPAPPHNPSFRTAGWTSLDTGSSQPAPPSGPAAASTRSAVPASPVASNQGGWSSANMTHSSSGGHRPSAPAPSPRQWQSSFAPAHPSAPPPPPPEPSSNTTPAPRPPSPPRLAAPVPEAKPARSNWQQFQKGVGRRK